MVTDIFQDHENLYTFLKQVSILPILEPELCDALLNITESAPNLAALEYQGLFVSRLADTPRVSYQCHLFIRELLCNELQQTSPDLFRSLHLRAAQIWADKQEYEQAVYHASQAQNDAVTASLIIDAAPFLQAQGRFETLLQWIDALSVTVREHSASLLVLHASLLLKLGLQEQAFPLLEAAEKAIQCDSDVEMQECVLLQSELRLLQSKWWFHAGNYQQSQKLCQYVLEKLSVDHSTLRAEAHLRLGVCANIVGNFGEGITHLQKALQYWGLRAKDQRVPEVHGALASAYSLMGNFVLAEHHLACALKLSDHFHDPWSQVYHLNRQGLLKHRQGLLTEAQACFEQALSLARDTLHFLRGEAYTLANLGEVMQDQEQYAQALQMLEEGLSLARQVGDVYLINCTICIAAMTYLFIGDAVTAQMLIDEIRINDARSNGYEQALRMLALGTILLFQKRYEEALNTLTQLEPYFSSSGFKREMIQLTIRLASCQIQQGLQAQALERLRSLLSLLKQQQFEHLIHLELRRTPAVEHFFAIHVQPENPHQALQIESEVLLATPEVPLIYQPIASAKAIAFHIVAFGEPAVVLHGTPITRWRMARAMELFFFLLYQDQPTQKEQILTALWPDFDERVNQTFHSTIYYLRKALGESCVCSHNNCYSLQLDSNDGDLFYDVARFKHYQHIAKKMLKEQAYEDAQSALSSLVDLYRGDYLQSFYSDWCILPRDELRQVYLWARERLAQVTWQQEQYDECIAHWQHMLAIDSCLEKAHLGLMRCYLQLGKRSSALQQYQRCCKVLQEELGTLPDAKLQMLYNKYVSV